MRVLMMSSAGRTPPMPSRRVRLQSGILIAAALATALGGRTACGASFDCGKSLSRSEALVCKNPDVSRLDERLARTYPSFLSMAKDRKRAMKSQERWLREVRDRCATAPCIRAAYRERLRVMESARAPDSPCPLVEADLLGSWQHRSGTGFFQEMAFRLDGPRRIFESWLHHRPEISGGSWRFEACTIYVKHPTEEALSVVMRVNGYRNGRIRLSEAGAAGDAVYERIKE